MSHQHHRHLLRHDADFLHGAGLRCFCRFVLPGLPPPAGTVFPPGTTNNIHCVATDCCTNTISCDFQVIVRSCDPCPPMPLALFNTGTDANGALAGGTVDPNYTFNLNPNAGGGTQAYVVSPAPGAWL